MSEKIFLHSFIHFERFFVFFSIFRLKNEPREAGRKVLMDPYLVWTEASGHSYACEPHYWLLI